MDLSWEQHTYLPLSADAEVGSLARYQQPGGSVVSINVGYAPHAYPEVLSLLAGYRRGINGGPATGAGRQCRRHRRRRARTAASP
jgi:membrane dipeptidase